MALSYSRDQYHQVALTLSQRLHSVGCQYVSSTLVLGEFHSHLLYLRGPAAALAALTRLVDDPAHEWQPVPTDLLRDARAKWLARFADQRFSLTDAVSFEIMSRDALTHAFAFDQHFETAGFALLR